MKTLHIFHQSDLKNGVEKTTCTLIVALKKLGVTPIAVVPAEGDVTTYLRSHNIKYRVIPFSCCASHSQRAQLHFFAESSSQQADLLSLIHEEAPEVVHINTGHLLHAGLAAAKCKIPAIWHIHAPFQEDLKRYKSAIAQGGYQWLLEKLSSQIIGVSQDVCQSLTKVLPADRIKTLYNGVDAEELKQSANTSSSNIRQELKLAHDTKLVIGVGRICAQKDFAAFARIASLVIQQNPDVFFIIAGPKQEEKAFELLDKEINQLQLTGRLFVLGPRNDIPALVVQSNVFLSTAVFEGHPIALMEVMALKTPVVAMACHGLRECILHEHDGLLIEPGNEHNAATAILCVLDNSELASKLGNNGQQSVNEKFSSKQYAEDFLTIAQVAIGFGPANISEPELELLEGLLGQIHQADQRITQVEQKTLWQHVEWLIWKLARRLKSWD